MTASAGSNFTANEGSSDSFTGTASGGFTPLTYAWTFGDGGTASGSLTPSHVYADNGSYTARLTVTDAKGTQVQPSLVATINNVAPTAQETAPSYGYAGSSLGFSATATDPSSVDTAAGFTYAWNFGDGATGTGASPSHTYTSAGTYTVSVTATDKDGGMSTAATKSISIGTPLTASAGSNFTANEGTSDSFAGTASGGFTPLTYAWTFGDGGTASGSLTPSHVYADNGSYTARLTVTDAKGTQVQPSLVATINNVAPTATRPHRRTATPGRRSASARRRPTPARSTRPPASPTPGTSATARPAPARARAIPTPRPAPTPSPSPPPTRTAGPAPPATKSDLHRHGPWPPPRGATSPPMRAPATPSRGRRPAAFAPLHVLLDLRRRRHGERLADAARISTPTTAATRPR